MAEDDRLCTSPEEALAMTSEFYDTESVMIVFENTSSSNLKLAWVDGSGSLHHYYSLDAGRAHVESCGEGHVFLCFRQLDGARPATAADVPRAHLVCAYRAQLQDEIVLVTDTISGTASSLVASIEVATSASDRYTGPIDIAGFSIYAEEGAWDASREAVTADLLAAAARLPGAARAALQASTCVWVSRECVPADSAHTVYHPRGAAGWLIAHRKPRQMAAGIEVCCCTKYMAERTLWAAGGVLLHELSHAYHEQHCAGGFECAAWLANYERAMAERLYESVRCHGPQGANGPIRAYCCTSAAEMFAELSVAFHGRDAGEETNKWYPFNHAQLVEHDPASSALLNELWSYCRTMEPQNSSPLGTP